VPTKAVGRPPAWVLQRRLCQSILGKEGTPEYTEFCQTMRRHLLAGILPPAITTLILHYGYGKPVEEIEVTDKTPDSPMGHLTEDQLRDRARRLSMAKFIIDTEPIETEVVETPQSTPVEANP